MENKKVKLNNLYLLRELCEAYKVKYNVKKPSLSIRKLGAYVTIERVNGTNFYIVLEIKIRPEAVEE